MRTDSHDGELTLPLPKIPQESGGAPRAPNEPPAPQEDGPAVRSWPRPSRRLVLGVLAALVALWAVSSIPAVKTVLRQSFSQLPAANTELYFTSSPSVSGTSLNVPITVNVHGTSARSVPVRVWLENASGKTDATASVTLTAAHGTAAKVVTLQLPADAEVVYVNLVGQPQTLHYRIAGIRIPTSTGGP
ncbi:hypothetical protein [Actinocrinis sp.]|uniref:hypothetical protein n=1 Tax=Actinocrinis sp. TaxID=1920516 RepID=UPI002D4033B2|nr:hypothetical protein [Actinocrinis sp.]HZP53366.1 hypothetical protein [Actinocrinis sp.]